MKYEFTCSQGHAPKVMTVEAMNDDEAMTKMMAMTKEHLAEMHKDMNMSDDEMKKMIMGGWRKM
ncbi:MAG: hypothetical protein HY092_02795 [Candidatus Kerfeldbacteria bacterium]|nr:hypothetical protein [Candidatus Kerfeldbacteria bacterium]